MRMANGPFPWKRGFLKAPGAVLEALDKITSRLIQVAATKRIPRRDIAAGLYAHVGLTIDSDGNIVVRQGNAPRADAGKWSERNSFGWEIVRKDLPMTTKSYSFEAPNFGDAARNGTSMRVIQREVYQRQVFEPRGLLINPEVMADGGDPVVVKFALNETLDRDFREFDRLFLWSLNVLQENTGVTGVYTADATREDFLGSITLSWEVFPPGTVEEVISRLSKVSIGVQKGPPIGVQKGPPSSSGVTGLAGVLFALVAAEGGRSPTGGATSAKRLLPVVPGVSCGA
jgi:hypothetical protein